MLVVVISRRPTLQRATQIILAEILAMQEFCVFNYVGEAVDYVMREQKPVICALLDWTACTRHSIANTKWLWDICRAKNPRFCVYYLIHTRTEKALSLWESWYRLVHGSSEYQPSQLAVIKTTDPNWPIHLAVHLHADNNQTRINRLFRATSLI